MRIPVIELSRSEASELLAGGEGHFVDFASTEKSPVDLTKTIAAFANTDGGELYIGISRVGRTDTAWCGFAERDDVAGLIQLAEHLFPPGSEFSYTFLAAPDFPGLVLKVAVAKTRDVRISGSGTPYVRRGVRNFAVKTTKARLQLERNKGLVSFETQTIDAPLRILTESRVMASFQRKIIPATDVKRWLAAQQLVVGREPTVAAVLLFSDEPQAYLPKHAGIKVYRYKTGDVEGSRRSLAFMPLTIEGALYNQIRDAVNATVRAIEDVRVISKTGLEPARYPREALHEIIANALLHRDYGIADDVHIRIFDNRVEVVSPGPLPAHITIRNILRERFSRNGGLVRLINRFPDPPNKDIGEGLQTAFSAMREHQLKTPRIVSRPESVAVAMRHERLGSPEEVVMAYLANQSEINNSTARELTGIGSENVVKRVFERLLAAGKIERIPGRRGKAIAYRATDAAETQLSLLE